MKELLPKQKGNLTELQCITAFYELGYAVSIPYGENSRYDFIADINGKLLRIQVKSSKLNDDKSAIIFRCVTTRTNSMKCIRKGYTNKEIDYFATFYNNQCYLVSVNECSQAKNLRFGNPKNNQNSNINFAKDYELENQLKRIIQE